MDAEVLSPKGIKKHFRLSSVVGKKVISENGEVVGRVKELAFDKNRIVGLYVKRGFRRPVLIDKDYIEHFHSDSVILKINPVNCLVGKLVFDKDGKKLGRVAKVIRKGTANDFQDIVVKKNKLTKGIKVPKKSMEVMGKNIILNKIF